LTTSVGKIEAVPLAVSSLPAGAETIDDQVDELEADEMEEAMTAEELEDEDDIPTTDSTL